MAKKQENMIDLISGSTKLHLNQFIQHEISTRTRALQKLLDPRRDLYAECGYPATLGIEEYLTLYEREGPAARVVNIFPEECWAMDPVISETQEEKRTPFELAFEELLEKKHVWHYLQRGDRLSRIGHYGGILLGLDDKKDFSEPVSGITRDGDPDPKAKKKQHELLYLSVFDESSLTIKQIEGDPRSKRFNQPVMYSVKLRKPESIVAYTDTLFREVDVHWTRIIHLADNRDSSEVFGVPAMKAVYNRLMDLRKIYGGSAEMLWCGGFPGYAFESTPDPNGGEIVFSDETKANLQDQITKFFNGIQRYLALTNLQVKSLAPTIADPSPHIEKQLEAICLTIGVPLRIFVGSEQAQLASGQDIVTFNKRLTKRQTGYINPMIIRPFIDRLQIYGILPTVKRYSISWPDLNAPTDQAKAITSYTKTRAMAEYMKNNLEALSPPLEFWTVIMQLPLEQAQAMVKAQKAHKPTLLKAIQAITGGGGDVKPGSPNAKSVKGGVKKQTRGTQGMDKGVGTK